MIRYKILFAIVLLNTVFTFGQTKTYKKYSNTNYKFSFDIPASWIIKYSKKQDGIICVPSNSFEKKLYSDCFEGVIFRVEFYKMGLDSTLLSEGLYNKKGNAYYTSDRTSDSVPTKKIQGKNWVGIYYNNVCGISCKSDGFHAAAGQCEVIYFSNANTTILLTTNGTPLKKSILNRIIRSFDFY
jgi:hypothetical protein